MLPLLSSTTVRVRDFSAHASLQPDLSRAVRATVAFMVPLLLASGGWLGFEVLAVAIAAQNIAMVDVRGDYRLRLGLLLAMVGVFVGAAALGAAAADNLLAALAATAVLASAGGLWRHLSNDYGPPLAISSTFVFLLALSSSTHVTTVGQHAFAALIGGAWGIVVQVANWPFRPQHPLRRIVGESWIAVADLFGAMIPDAAVAADRRQEQLQTNETALRTTLDAGYAALEAMRPGPLRQQLEALNLAAARLATRVVALNTALETTMREADFQSLAPTLEPALVSLTNLSRSVAVTVVSRQPGHLATFEVRLRRVTSLLRVLRARVLVASEAAPAHAQLAEIVRQIEQQLPAIHDAVRVTIERSSEPSASSLELLDLRALALRPLASALNLSLQFDPALVRYTLRLALLMMAGVLVFKAGHLAHGYWLPFTIIVVLQPDYGSTRERAAQRVLGTIAGGIVASGLIWLELPFAALMTATAVTMFAFGYLVRRNYALAIFFITLFIVLLTEATGPVTMEFALERLASTIAGGALALIAAQIFWPVWERDRLPAIQAGAFRANREYARLLIARLTRGGGFDAEATAAKRRAEGSNAGVFSSLRRMSGDPRTQQEGIEFAATLANGNNRVTRVLNVLSLHLTPGVPLAHPALTDFETLASEALDQLAAAVESGAVAADRLEALIRTLEGGPFRADVGPERDRWVFSQLTRAATELNALLLAVQDAAPVRSGEAPG